MRAATAAAASLSFLFGDLVPAAGAAEPSPPKITVIDPDPRPLLINTLAEAKSLTHTQRTVAVVEYSIPDEDYLEFFQVLEKKKVVIHLKIHTSKQRREHQRGNLFQFLGRLRHLKHLTVFTRSPKLKSTWDGLGGLKSLETLYFWDIG